MGTEIERFNNELVNQTNAEEERKKAPGGLGFIRKLEVQCERHDFLGLQVTSYDFQFEDCYVTEIDYAEGLLVLKAIKGQVTTHEDYMTDMGGHSTTKRKI